MNSKTSFRQVGVLRGMLGRAHPVRKPRISHLTDGHLGSDAERAGSYFSYSHDSDLVEALKVKLVARVHTWLYKQGDRILPSIYTCSS